MYKILILNDLHHGVTRESTTHPGEKRQANSEALSKLSEYIDIFNSRKYDSIVNLGDAIRDVSNKDKDLLLLDEAMKVFSRISGPKFFIPGNHELKTLKDSDISEVVSRYNISSCNPQIIRLGGFQVLFINSEVDQNSLGKIPEKSITWIEENINLEMPTIVFSHYSIIEIDGYANFYFDQDHRYMTYTNGHKLLSILNQIPKVIAVNAHTHMGSYKKILNISAVSALAFSENILSMDHPDSNPGVYSELWIDTDNVCFKSFSGKYCFLNIEF